MRLKTVILLACLCVLTVAPSAFAQLGPAIGNITTSGATCSATSPSANCVTLKLDGSTGAATILITGTFVGTGQFEVSNDGLSTWTNINCTPPNSTTAASSATSTGSWQCNVAGWEHIRVRASAFASGTMSVVINGAHASAKSSGGGAVYASGLGTNNVIPKGNGAGQLADSSVTDDGTKVATAEPLNLTATTSASNAIVQFGATNKGLFNASSGTVGLTVDLTGDWLQISNTANSQIGAPLAGIIGWSSSATFGAAGNDTYLGREAAGVPRVGLAASASPVARTFQIGESSRSGTDSNVAASSGAITPGIGTGLGAGTKLCLQRDIMGATGSTAQNQRDGYCVGPSKTLSNTSATAQSLVNISVPSNSAGGVEGTITITCTDGTNFDSETQSFNTSFVNKAGAMTVTAPVITATSAANNSGSCTAGITAVAGTNSVDIKVTPVLSTIVPTTVTSYIALRNNGTGNVTFN